VSPVKSMLTDACSAKQSNALPELSDDERRACIQQLAQEAMEAIPAYLAQLRNN
jgi:hypothetical protein